MVSGTEELLSVAFDEPHFSMQFEKMGIISNIYLAVCCLNTLEL